MVMALRFSERVKLINVYRKSLRLVLETLVFPVIFETTFISLTFFKMTSKMETYCNRTLRLSTSVRTNL